MTHLLFASQYTVDVAKSCSNEEIISLGLRNSSLDIPSRSLKPWTLVDEACAALPSALSILTICVVLLHQFLLHVEDA